MAALIPLHLLPIGETGVIANIVGDSTATHRLNELGFREGASVEMVQSGSACIVRLSGHKLGFRSDDAAHVFVRLMVPMGVAG